MRNWPLAQPELSPTQAGVVQCWRIPIDPVAGSVAAHLQSLLDATERERLGRFRQADDQRRFLAAHAGVRILLGAALGRAPQAIRIVQRTHGKPALAASIDKPGDEPAIEFSLAHSGRVALVALACGAEVGIDVEEVRPLPDRDPIAARFFHRSEAAELAALGEGKKDVAFFRTWTRKEAVTKALGLGLSLELNSFRVSCGPTRTCEVHFFAGDYPPDESWTLVDIDPEAGYVGAIAIALRPVLVACRTLDLASSVGRAQA